MLLLLGEGTGKAMSDWDWRGSYFLSVKSG